VIPYLFLLLAQDLGFPNYTASSIANTGANEAAFYAPNTLVSIYGVNLAFDSRAIGPADIRNGNLPTSLGTTPVRVLINNQFASLYFVSPHQVNALIPPHLLPGPATLQVVLSGRAGPAVPLTLEDSAPGLFETEDHFVIATHATGAVITPAAPAEPGEVVVLYATGLGPTNPLTQPNRIPTTAARLTNSSSFQVQLNGVPVEHARIEYAGVTPGFAGLFQINVKLPDDLSADPEVRVGTDRLSPAGRYLATSLRANNP